MTECHRQAPGVVQILADKRPRRLQRLSLLPTRPRPNAGTDAHDGIVYSIRLCACAKFYGVVLEPLMLLSYVR